MISDGHQESTFHIKRIPLAPDSKTEQLILTQNRNGPCPLLALVNILLLQGRLQLPQADSGAETISAEELLGCLAHELLQNSGVVDDGKEDDQISHAVMEAIDSLPALLAGMNINIRFDSCQSMEPLKELTVFDLFKVRLYHGWLVDPNDQPTAQYLLPKSNANGPTALCYNKLMERLITLKQPPKGDYDEEREREALVLQDFIDRTAQQLTDYGLARLREEMLPDSFAVLFRNNHFSVLHNHGGIAAMESTILPAPDQYESETTDRGKRTLNSAKPRLLQLVTDQGYLGEPEVVWETLDNTRGDSRFLNWQFHMSAPEPTIGSPLVDWRPPAVPLQTTMSRLTQQQQQSQPSLSSSTTMTTQPSQTGSRRSSSPSVKCSIS